MDSLSLMATDAIGKGRGCNRRAEIAGPYLPMIAYTGHAPLVTDDDPMNRTEQTEFAGAMEFDICSPMLDPSSPPPFGTSETEARSPLRAYVSRKLRFLALSMDFRARRSSFAGIS